MSIKSDILKVKAAATVLSTVSCEIRNAALESVAKALEENKEEIFKQNAKDLENAEKLGIGEAVKKRLSFNEDKLKSVTDGIYQLINLEDPIGKITLSRELDSDLKLYRVTCPIGVIGVIFEARPDALVQIATLCLKSGNCAVLKGGKETAYTNKILFDIIYNAAISSGLPEHCLLQASTHSEIDELLDCGGYVDLLIPRGSNGFVKYIMENTQIPVMGHSDGICHIYVDKEADLKKASSIVTDAKIQYCAACNAVETLLVNRQEAHKLLPELISALKKAGVTVNATREVADICQVDEVVEDGFNKEYLDLAITVKLTDNVKTAIEYINKNGSHHTDAIITENIETAEEFLNGVDSADVYFNCSTRFSDGFRYGFGAEVGISTGKLHARGPVGLEGLVTYKYKIYGNGNIVGDYAKGIKKFNFKDI